MRSLLLCLSTALAERRAPAPSCLSPSFAPLELGAAASAERARAAADGVARDPSAAEILATRRLGLEARCQRPLSRRPNFSKH